MLAAGFLALATATCGRSTEILVDTGNVTSVVDKAFVSFVLDPASLEINPPGVFPHYPYPVNVSSTRLRSFAKQLAPAYFIIAGGATDCITYGNFRADGADACPAVADQRKFMSAYCNESAYYGCLHRGLWDEVLEFARASSTKLVFHLNSAFGRAGGGMEPHGARVPYMPWNASEALPLMRYTMAKAAEVVAGWELIIEAKGSKTGHTLNASQMANDYSILRAAVGAAATSAGDGTAGARAAAAASGAVVLGPNNQGLDTRPDIGTDADYRAIFGVGSSSSNMAVSYSYYMRTGCSFNATSTTIAMVNLSNLAPLTLLTEHYAQLARNLSHTAASSATSRVPIMTPSASAPMVTSPVTSSTPLPSRRTAYRAMAPPVWFAAGAACTHAPEPQGWGAVNAFANVLWLADALGRTATAGGSVFGYQTLIGGCYGLLDNSTYMPNPAFYLAVLHTRLMGRAVLSVAVTPGSDVHVYSHCANNGTAGAVVLLAINPGSGTVGMHLSTPLCGGVREQYVLTAATDDDGDTHGAGRLTSRLAALNGRTLHATTDGTLPGMRGAVAAGGCAEPVLLPPQSASFIVLPNAVHPACS